MQRFLVEGVLAKIAADLPQFKTVRLFNDDMGKAERGEIDSFRMPALFVSFPDGVDYVERSGKLQRAPQLTMRFFIVTELTKVRSSISKTVLDIFDLKQEVYKQFRSFQLNNTNEVTTTFTRVREETDEDRTNYYVLIQDYLTNLIDSDAWIRNQGTEYTILNLDIVDEVVINPTTKQDGKGIRTAKDVNDG